MTGANDNRALAAVLGITDLVAGGVDHVAKVTVTLGPASCGSFRKVSALQNARGVDLAGRYLSVQQLATRPVLRLVDRDA